MQNSTNNIVHWKDVVGKDFLLEFEKITRAIVFAEKSGREAIEVLKKVDPGIRDKYELKRHLLKKCGYTITGKHGYTFTGWHTPYLDHDSVRFMTTSAPGRHYISMNAFLDWKQGLTVEDDVEEYYNTKEIINVVQEELEYI